MAGDPALGLRFARAGAADAGRPAGELRLRRYAWLAVLLLHAGLWWMLVRSMAPALPPGPAALEVLWLPRRAEPAIPPMPRPPRRPHAVARAPMALAPAESAAAIPKTPAGDATPVDADGRTRIQLFQRDGSLRWEAPPATARAWDGTARILRDRVTRLPGQSDAASVEAVRLRLRARMTPERIVQAVLRFLGGMPVRDDCPVIEDRLRQSDDDVVREIDLYKFRKFCAS